MANRSYLYSTKSIPYADTRADGQYMVGISEWAYAIPLVFKILLSGDPRTCLSSIWNTPEEIALYGDYVTGVRNLEAFLSQVTLPAAQPLIVEALAFLKKPENQNPYFILEGGEIFAFENIPSEDQNRDLLKQVQNLQPEIDVALQSLQMPTDKAQKRAYNPIKRLSALGLGNWSNTLYFDFSQG